MTNAIILIVEDQYITAADLFHRLEALGYNVLPPSFSGPEALAAAAAHKPDLAIMDVYLPGPFDGIETAVEMRRRFELPVIFFTAYGDLDLLARAKAAEPFGYLLKPSSGYELRAAIEMALTRADLENRLRRRETEYRHMFEFSNDAVFVHDANGRILEVNHRAAEIFGMTRDELLARNVRTLHPPEEQPRLMEILERLRNQGWARFESRFVRSDGSLVDVEISTRVLDNGLTRIQGLVREIGERKAVQRTLERVGAQWRRTFDTIPDMIVLLDGGLKVLRANRALADQLGRPFDRIIGQSYFSLMYQTDRPEAGCPLVQALENGQTGVVDHGFPAIPGRFTSTVSPFVDDGGRAVGAVVLSRDVTARKEAEAERERLIGELSRALMEVKRLSGLLPICSSCKKIRDDTGYWEQIEQYFQDRTDVLFSHGICPDCAERLYPRLARDL